MKFEYKTEVIKESIKLKVYIFDGDNKIGHSLLSADNNTWTITGWYVNEKYQNQGLGKQLLLKSFLYLNNLLGTPSKIEYIWNGANEYIMDWLTHNFSPVSMCPINVQKYQADDDWSSHIYILDTNKVLSYFGIKDKTENVNK